MSLILAPYNNAMRLGMGFNSYTQTLCINDVVQKPNGVKASENDLRATSLVDNPKTITEAPSAAAQRDLLAGNSGTTTIISNDGQSLVSQTVSWEAKFVDKISDVTDSMNISGSLAIKIDAIGGGGKAEGHFIDTNTFKESDLNYLIQVKVTNQKLIADDVSQFTPIKHVQPNQFTEVYGDSFISGFLEGGIFNAVVSMKFKDKSAVRDMGGSLAVGLKFAGVEIGGSAAVDKKSGETNTEHETTISVSWSGGGDIKPDDIKEWTVPTLMSVAMEFPDRVARCPQRTSAILTKYTALRSYHEQNLKGSPLDYENAGVYASALLDAYMDYKSIWKTVQTTMWEVDVGISSLEARESNEDLEEVGKQAKADYEQRLQRYKSVMDQKTARNHVATPVDVDGEPLEPNKVIPYKANVFGLDQAKRDCRFEMIKIVREVDAVTMNPEVAVDTRRTWQYLSPIIFRRLLPISRIITKVEETKNLADLKKEYEALVEVLKTKTSLLEKAEASLAEVQKQLDALTSERSKSQASSKITEDQLESTKRELEASKATAKAAETAFANVKTESDQKDAKLLETQNAQRLGAQAQSGLLNPAQKGWSPGRDKSALVKQDFPVTLSGAPRLLFGLRILDLEKSQPKAFGGDVRALTNTGFTALVQSFGGCFSYGADMSWLTLPNNGVHFENGSYYTGDETNGRTQGIARRIHFAVPFDSPPKVYCWFNEIHKEGSEWFCLRTYPSDISNSGFTLEVNAWAGRWFDSARISWFAYDSAEDGKRVKSGKNRATREDRSPKFKNSFYGSPFAKKPATFIAISEIDFGMDENIRAIATIDDVTATELQWSCGTWDNSNMDHMDITWIAME